MSGTHRAGRGSWQGGRSAALPWARTVACRQFLREPGRRGRAGRSGSLSEGGPPPLTSLSALGTPFSGRSTWGGRSSCASGGESGPSGLARILGRSHLSPPARFRLSQRDNASGGESVAAGLAPIHPRSPSQFSTPNPLAALESAHHMAAEMAAARRTATRLASPAQGHAPSRAARQRRSTAPGRRGLQISPLPSPRCPAPTAAPVAPITLSSIQSFDFLLCLTSHPPLLRP